MTTLIEQKTNADCVLACIAMATGKSYEEIFDILIYMFGKEKANYFINTSGIDYSTEYYILERFDWKPVFFHLVRPEYRSIISVPSLNNSGGLHSIFWDGTKIYDPSTKIKYDSNQYLGFASIVNYNDDPEGITSWALYQRKEFQKYIK